MYAGPEECSDENTEPEMKSGLTKGLEEETAVAVAAGRGVRRGRLCAGRDWRAAGVLLFFCFPGQLSFSRTQGLCLCCENDGHSSRQLPSLGGAVMPSVQMSKGPRGCKPPSQGTRISGGLRTPTVTDLVTGGGFGEFDDGRKRGHRWFGWLVCFLERLGKWRK